MYEAFYGLSGKPFQLNPDPDFYFASKPHRRARAYLEYGVLGAEGFIVITGEVGAGKTTLVRGLLESLDPGNVVAAHLVSTQLGAEDTLRLVGAAFGVRVKDSNKADLLMALEAFFITQLTQGKRCLLVVDEAQNLKPQAVEELRMLSNFQHGQQSLLKTFLVGQPEFREILQSPDMLQLRQRVTASCHLGPLDPEDTRAYIEHRLKKAGATDRPSFDPEVFSQIYDHTGGIPRRINTLCDRLMLHGFLGDNPHFSAEVLAEVVEELDEEHAMTSGHESRPVGRRPETLGEPVDLGLHPAEASELAAQLMSVSAEQLSERLNRLERSVLQQERVSQEILGALQRLLGNGRRMAGVDGIAT